MNQTNWNGFDRIDFLFEDRKAILVFPKQADEGKWLFKTEYFDAFPAYEIEMLKSGYHLAYLENKTRWCLPEDIDAKERFCAYLQEKYGLKDRCVPVGMSCGGMHAVYFAAKYPNRIAGLYIDAPVMNLLSCPCGMGDADDSMYVEFTAATGFTKSQMLNYRNHPIDVADKLIQNRIPVFMVCGDSDRVVPYHENGKLLYEKYMAAGADITLVLKPGCDHHPHGLDDHSALISFAQECYQR